MITFLTSSPGGQNKINGRRSACKLNETNHFLENLKTYWCENSRCIIICSDPTSYEINDSIRDIFTESFPMSGLSLKSCIVWDERNREEVIELKDFDVIILAGGHVPTQNRFLKEINLKAKVKSFTGILIGISAGSMNSASTVYAQPELEGESMDPQYKRFISGLGLTNKMIIPHYQDIKDDILDGKRLMEDITYPDSIGRKFIALVDGSYILIKEENETLYGEGYFIENGKLSKVSSSDEMFTL
jgi:peptidase E